MGFVDAMDFADDAYWDVRYNFVDESYPNVDVVYYGELNHDVYGTSMLSNTVAVMPVKHDAGVSVLQGVYQIQLMIRYYSIVTAQNDAITVELYICKDVML